MIADGDTVVLPCTFSGRHTGHFMGLAPTNRPFASRQVHIIRFQDGRGIEHLAVGDDLNFLRQVGAFPSQPARPVPADAQVGWLGSAWVAQASHQDPTQRRIRRAMPACCRLRWCAGVVALAAVKGCWPGCGRPLLAAGGALPLCMRWAAVRAGCQARR